jgi:sugar O-acyltransferase (sialic acid O-acetyltransferase NeuD family)
MAKVVVFGTRDFASLAHYYLRTDSEHEVVAFAVHREFMPDTPVFENLPVVALDELDKNFPASRYAAFAPMSHTKMNRQRESVYNELKAQGYSLISYISSRATCLNEGAIGDNCFILENNTIQPFVTIGNNVVLWSGNHIGHHSQIMDHVFFTSHVVLSGHCIVNRYCFLGVNATIRDQLTLEEGTLVGMGANITKSTEPWSVYKAESARAAKVSSQDLDF